MTVGGSYSVAAALAVLILRVSSGLGEDVILIMMSRGLKDLGLTYLASGALGVRQQL